MRASSFADGMIIQLSRTALCSLSVKHWAVVRPVQTFPNHRKPCPSASQRVAPVVTVVAMVGIHLQMGALSDIPIQFDGVGR